MDLDLTSTDNSKSQENSMFGLMRWLEHAQYQMVIL